MIYLLFADHMMDSQILNSLHLNIEEMFQFSISIKKCFLYFKPDLQFSILDSVKIAGLRLDSIGYITLLLYVLGNTLDS